MERMEIMLLMTNTNAWNRIWIGTVVCYLFNVLRLLPSKDFLGRPYNVLSHRNTILRLIDGVYVWEEQENKMHQIACQRLKLKSNQQIGLVEHKD